MGQSVGPVKLAHATLLAFQEYAGQAETAMDHTLAQPQTFLWSDTDGKRREQVRGGETVASLWSGKHPVRVPDGLIHDWIGATFVPDICVGNAIALVQDYDNHKDIYKLEVSESKLISQNGDHFEIYLRLIKKKIVTVVLDTWHDVQYSALDPKRWAIRSETTRISEVEHAGKPDEKVGPPDSGHGYLWRLNSYWRLFERDGGTYIECRAISLTRDVPKALAWIIEPMVKKLPKQSLIATLDSTRRALRSEPVPVTGADEPAKEPGG